MKYTEEFERLWQLRPKRVGGDPKPLAYKQYKARIKQGVLYRDLKAGYTRYANFCDKTGKTDTEFVMRAATFFGINNEAWCESWELPKVEIKETTEQKGIRLGMPARPGESFDEWDRRIAQAR